MQVAVGAVRVVERALHVVVDVVAVGDGRVARLGVRGAALDGRAAAGPPAVHGEAVLVGVAVVLRVEVAVVEVVRVVSVADFLVAAPLPVAVRVLLVLLAAHVNIVAPRGRRVNRGIIL